MIILPMISEKLECRLVKTMKAVIEVYLNIEQFIVQLMHTNYKILRLLK